MKACGASVADQENPVERQPETLTGVDRVEPVAGAIVTLDRRPTGRVVKHHREHEIARIDHQACADQIAVVGVVGRATAGLDLQNDLVLRMETIDLVGHDRPTDLAESTGRRIVPALVLPSSISNP